MVLKRIRYKNVHLKKGYHFRVGKGLKPYSSEMLKILELGTGPSERKRTFFENKIYTIIISVDHHHNIYISLATV